MFSVASSSYAIIRVIDMSTNRELSCVLYDTIDAFSCEFEVLCLAVSLVFYRDRRVEVDYFDIHNRVIYTRHLG